MNKKLNIIHLDMDAFYAAVEEADNPKVKGKAVIISGISQHGVVTTANYEARKYGVHSAMPVFMAKKLCPNGIFIRPRMERYKEISKSIFEIVKSQCKNIEQISIDEAYLDISDIEISGMDLVNSLKNRIYKEFKLSFSAGISYNKFLAKLASDWNKPNGIKIISEDMIPQILLPLKIEKIHGIGQKTCEELNNIGIYIISDLMKLSEEFLTEVVGKSGSEIYKRIRGEDARKIKIIRERKSVGTENTFEVAIKDIKKINNILYDFARELSEHLDLRQLQGRTVTVKLKNRKHITKTMSKTVYNYIHSQEEIIEIVKIIMKEIVQEQEYRLIGLSVSNLCSRNINQLSIF